MSSPCTERVRPVTGEPGFHVVVVELLGPQHPGQRLAGNQLLVHAQVSGQEVGVELVRFGPTVTHDLLEIGDLLTSMDQSLPKQNARTTKTFTAPEVNSPFSQVNHYARDMGEIGVIERNI